MEAKSAFKQECMTHGVAPKRYHTDNGRYAEIRSKMIAKPRSRALHSEELIAVVCLNMGPMPTCFDAAEFIKAMMKKQATANLEAIGQ